jgi:hypothetical protein
LKRLEGLILQLADVSKSFRKRISRGKRRLARSAQKPPRRHEENHEEICLFPGGQSRRQPDMKTRSAARAGLAEMTNAGLPVPAGFTISTGLQHLLRAGQQAAARS